MGTDNSLHLHQIIVHGVDHFKEKPELFDTEAVFVGGAAGFIIEHILKNRAHKNSRDAVFRDSVNGPVNFAQLCYELLENPENFISTSKRIAGFLFECMRGNRSISQGDLVVCTFSEPTPDHPRQLALLKMDPEGGVYWRAGGTTRWSFSSKNTHDS